VPSETQSLLEKATARASDRAIARHAGSQRGLILIQQLREIGLSDQAVSQRVKAGRLHRRSRGVYAVGHVALSRECEFLAAAFAGGKGSILACGALAEFYGLTKQVAPVIHVLVPGKRKAPPGVRFHQVRNLSARDVTSYKGIPCATIPRLFVDMTDHTTADELANLMHEAAHRKRFVEKRVLEAAGRAKGRHNLHVLYEALELRQQGSAGTRSRAERAMRKRFVQAGIETLPNVTIEGFEVDLHVPGTNLIVEVDGPGHARPRTQRDDALRDQVLEAAGFEVIRSPATRPGGP